MRRFLLVTALLFQLKAYSQNEGIDPKKRDSLIRAINGSVKAMRTWQDSFTKKQDSFLDSARQVNETAGGVLADPVAGGIKKKERKRQPIYIGIGIGALLLLALTIGLIKRRHHTHKF